jgi:hypothetical protein
VLRLPGRGEAEGDGEEAARLHALVPRRVHRRVAALSQDVPGVPDSSQRGGGGYADESGGCRAHSGQLNWCRCYSLNNFVADNSI